MSPSDSSPKSRINDDAEEHLMYTSDVGLDYDLTDIDKDVQRIIDKIDACLDNFKINHQFLAGGDVVVPSE